MPWLLQVAGEDADLTFLAGAFVNGDIRVFKAAEEGYFLSSQRFEGLEGADAVKDAALIIAAILNGVCRIALNGTEPIAIGNAVYRDEHGKSHYHLLPEPGVYQIRGIPASLPAILSGSMSKAPETTVREWSLLALKDPAVAKVTRINALAPLDWVNLYRILEIVQDDIGGLNVVASRKWMSRTSIRRFKHTANSADVLGLEARHGVQTNDAPAVPMTIVEARKLVRGLTWHWLRSKS